MWVSCCRNSFPSPSIQNNLHAINQRSSSAALRFAERDSVPQSLINFSNRNLSSRHGFITRTRELICLLKDLNSVACTLSFSSSISSSIDTCHSTSSVCPSNVNKIGATLVSHQRATLKKQGAHLKLASNLARNFHWNGASFVHDCAGVCLSKLLGIFRRLDSLVVQIYSQVKQASGWGITLPLSIFQRSCCLRGRRGWVVTHNFLTTALKTRQNPTPTGGSRAPRVRRIWQLTNKKRPKSFVTYVVLGTRTNYSSIFSGEACMQGIDANTPKSSTR